jgi:hypothetical protein
MNRALLVAALALAAALSAPATSFAGGWATVGLSSTPDGAKPGETWVVDLTVLQHGRTPLEGVQPRVMIARDGGDPQVFAARPTDRLGVYRAAVVFPRAGEWSYSVDDDFSQVHQFGTVSVARSGDGIAAAATSRVEQPPADSGGGTSLLAALGIAAAAGLIAALATGLLRRRQPAQRAPDEPRPAAG